MPKMLELIRTSAVPANVVRTAAKGALDIPAGEMLEILVHLSGHPLFGEQAMTTLAAWDFTSASAAVSNPTTPKPVLSYFADPAHLRPDLFPALMDNPAVPDSAIAKMAEKGLRTTVEALLKHPRTHKSARILHALCRNDNLRLSEFEPLETEIAQLSQADPNQEEELTEAALAAFREKHAADLAAEQDRAFELFRHGNEEAQDDNILEQSDSTPGNVSEFGSALTESAPQAVAVASNSEVAQACPAEHDLVPKPAPPPERVSTFQKISRMNVGDRVQLAMKGNRDERFILIRDGSKVVSAAVLESPKLTDSEVETFASMKNVQESVLRTIASKRKFMKLYAVIRALANNPRTPLDVSMPLLNHLLVTDLRALSTNKNISDMLRKLGLKIYKERSEKKQH